MFFGSGRCERVSSRGKILLPLFKPLGSENENVATDFRLLVQLALGVKELKILGKKAWTEFPDLV